MPIKILILQKIHDDGLKLLHENNYITEVAESSDEEYLIERVKDFNGIFVRGMVPLTRKIIEAADKCEVIGRHGVGLETIDLKTATENNIPVIYAPGSNSDSVAEHAVALMMTLAKKICKLNNSLKYYNDYNIRLSLSCFELKDKTLGLIGLGNIGKKVARICEKGFNMKVIGYDPYITNEMLKNVGIHVCLVKSIDEVLKNSDIVSLHLPSTKDNSHLIGEKELALMKKNSLLINTARGTLIDEEALCKAVSTGVITGAGLDVFFNEPPIVDNPLFKLDNIVVTPHTAAHSQEANRNMAIMVAKGMVDVINGKRPMYIANPEIWEIRRERK